MFFTAELEQQVILWPCDLVPGEEERHILRNLNELVGKRPFGHGVSCFIKVEDQEHPVAPIILFPNDLANCSGLFNSGPHRSMANDILRCGPLFY